MAPGSPRAKVVHDVIHQAMHEAAHEATHEVPDLSLNATTSLYVHRVSLHHMHACSICSAMLALCSADQHGTSAVCCLRLHHMHKICTYACMHL